MGLSVPQLLIILLIVVLIFGTSRLKSLGGDLGKAVRSFRKAMNTVDTEEGAPAPPKLLPGESGASAESEASSDARSATKV
jgi:sec-independent protein translocase protein TatA